jgi:hypothetical protein
VPLCGLVDELLVLVQLVQSRRRRWRWVWVDLSGLMVVVMSLINAVAGRRSITKTVLGEFW